MLKIAKHLSLLMGLTGAMSLHCKHRVEEEALEERQAALQPPSLRVAWLYLFSCKLHGLYQRDFHFMTSLPNICLMRFPPINEVYLELEDD